MKQSPENINAQLLRECKKALGIAENWIHDDLDGVSGLKEALAELDSVRQIIAKAEKEVRK